MKRCRHLHTVWFDVRHRRATSALLIPSAHDNTSFARKARCRFTRARWVNRTSSSRSSATRTRGAFGRPITFMSLLDHKSISSFKLFRFQGTSRLLKKSPVAVAAGAGPSAALLVGLILRDICPPRALRLAPRRPQRRGPTFFSSLLGVG